VADQVISDLAEGFAGQDRVSELFERLVVDLLDRGDEVVEADGGGDLAGIGPASTLG
jgi:hypothetical protein